MGRNLLRCGGGGVVHCTPTWRQQLVAMGLRVPNACSNPSNSCALNSVLNSYRGSYRALTRCSN